MKKKNIIISLTLLLLTIVFTVLVMFVDVKPLGVNETNIGLSTINIFFENLIGTSDLWLKITDVLGLASFAIALVYGLIGLVELIKRKSLTKVDSEIYKLAGLYVVMLSLYVIFDKVVINYRPILIEGEMEASYPSSHTMLALCLCFGGIIINRKLFSNVKFIKLINILMGVMGLFIVVGRTLSGQHWITDIIGGVLFSLTLLSMYKTSIDLKKEN